MSFRCIVLLTLAGALCAFAGAHAASVPSDQVDSGQIYVGSASAFESPAEVDITSVIESTPEYQQIKKEKLDSGTGKYWILYSQASDRAIRAVASVASNENYDLVAESGYLGSLSPVVSCDDITNLAIDEVTSS